MRACCVSWSACPSGPPGLFWQGCSVATGQSPPCTSAWGCSVTDTVLCTCRHWMSRGSCCNGSSSLLKVLSEWQPYLQALLNVMLSANSHGEQICAMSLNKLSELFRGIFFFFFTYMFLILVSSPWSKKWKSISESTGCEVNQPQKWISSSQEGWGHFLQEQCCAESYCQIDPFLFGLVLTVLAC